MCSRWRDAFVVLIAGAIATALPREVEAAPAHLVWAQSLVDTIKPAANDYAASYHDAIEVEDGFDLIESIHDVQPGDIVAIRYDDAGCSELTCGGFTGCTTTGHVAIVAAAPARRSTRTASATW
jgi:hypothetical protein